MLRKGAAPYRACSHSVRVEVASCSHVSAEVAVRSHARLLAHCACVPARTVHRTGTPAAALLPGRHPCARAGACGGERAEASAQRRGDGEKIHYDGPRHPTGGFLENLKNTENLRFFDFSNPAEIYENLRKNPKTAEIKQKNKG